MNNNLNIAYIIKFCEKHEFDVQDIDFVTDDIIFIADYYISISDIMFDIDNNIDNFIFWLWYDLTIEEVITVDYQVFTQKFKTYEI